MKIFLFRILLAAAVTLVAFALASSAPAQPSRGGSGSRCSSPATIDDRSVFSPATGTSRLLFQ